jgi:hypothetical protein
MKSQTSGGDVITCCLGRDNPDLREWSNGETMTRRGELKELREKPVPVPLPLQILHDVDVTSD